jgi:hypothetical protein
MSPHNYSTVTDDYFAAYIRQKQKHSIKLEVSYRAFHGFRQAKFAFGGLILGSSQFTILPQLPLKMMLNLKVVKMDFF